MYEWKITELKRRTSDNFVLSATFTLSKIENEGTDTEKVTTVYGFCSWGNEQPTINYTDLDEATVLSWIYQQFDKENSETNMKLIRTDPNLPVIDTGIPWSE